MSNDKTSLILVPGLLCTEHLSRAPEFEVSLGDSETVTGLAHYANTLSRVFSQWCLVQQHAGATGSPATDAATQLM